MNKNELAIATMTWARNEDEEKLLQTAITHLAKLDIPVFITDGGSRESFLKFLSTFPHIHVLQPSKGLWFQVKNSLTEASKKNTDFIFYTEPDKADFFANALPGMIERITPGESTGIILASRSTDAFATFPLFQQMTETTINNCCKELTGEAFDYTYGPFLLNKKLLHYIDTLPENIGWGWRPFVFHLAKRLGLGLESIVGDFECPADQREDDDKERVYRMKQLAQNIEGLVLSTSVALEK